MANLSSLTNRSNGENRYRGTAPTRFCLIRLDSGGRLPNGEEIFGGNETAVVVGLSNRVRLGIEHDIHVYYDQESRPVETILKRLYPLN